MIFKKSKHSAFYFFLLFVFGLFSISLYKSINAILSPKQIETFLVNKLEKEVDAKKIHLGKIEFHLFSSFLFKPAIEWHDLDISYQKNCNEVSIKAARLMVYLDLSQILKKSIEIKEIRGPDLDLQILRNKNCDKYVKGDEVLLPVSKAISTEEPTSLKVKTANRKKMSYVKRLPSFSFQRLQFSTEKNESRYYVFENFHIRSEKNAYKFSSNLSFSEGTGLGYLPKLSMKGVFDQDQNILLDAYLRESSIRLKVESLGEKNYRTSLSLRDFPLNYILGTVFKGREKLPFSGHWLNLNAYTISHWEDFFAKKAPLQIDSLEVVGENAEIQVQPFLYHLKQKEIIGGMKFKVVHLKLDEIPIFYEYVLPYPKNQMKMGVWRGDVEYSTEKGWAWQGEREASSFYVLKDRSNLILNYDKAKSEGSIYQKEFREKLTDIHIGGDSVIGSQSLSYDTEKGIAWKINLKKLPKPKLSYFTDLTDIDVESNKTAQGDFTHIVWHKVKSAAFHAAKVEYTEELNLNQQEKLWDYYNIEFLKENSFTSALSLVKTDFSTNMRLLRAKRIAKKSKDGSWISRWDLQMNKPYQWLSIKQTSASDWRVVGSKPKSSIKNMVFEEEAFPHIH